MTRYAKCIDNSYVEDALTVGKKYKILDNYDGDIMIKDNNGNNTYYCSERFAFVENNEEQSEVNEKHSVDSKLNSLKELVLFLANRQENRDLEEYETLKNLISEVEEQFSKE